MRHDRRLRRTRLVAAGSLAALVHVCPACAQTGLALGDALREALKLNPNVSLQRQQVQVNRGLELIAQGQFDPVLNGTITRSRDFRPLREDEKNLLALVNPTGTVPFAAQISNAITYSVGVDRTFQTGISLGASVGVTTLFDNVSGLNNIPAQTAGRLSFTVRAPLLRNAGREATTANLDAAEAEAAAAKYDLVFSNAQTLLSTALAYWDYVAQVRRLNIARDAHLRSALLVEETRRLIDADQLPSADSRLVLANEADRLRARISAEQTVAEARRTLALQIGLSPQQLAELPPPADDFPRYDGQPLGFEAPLGFLLDLALDKRADITAEKLRARAARRRLDAAVSGLRPQVDVVLGVGYDTLVESRAPFSLGQIAGSNRVGPSANASLSAQFPWRNTRAEGAYVAQSAILSQSEIRIRNISDVIGGAIHTNAQALVRSAQALVQSAEATRYYVQSVENERTKRRLGISTLIDVINVEDRLTDALVSEVLARQAYANAIAQLRFDLGTIVLERAGQFDVPVEDLFNPVFRLAR